MDNYFNELYAVNCNDHTEPKGRLTYLSWTWAWAEVKKRHPDATYKVYENPEGWNYWTDGRTAWVKTSVTINGIEHMDYLPIMDYHNDSLPLEKVTSFDVNKTIQRSITKACARHGLGLYIYAGEDLPEDSSEKPKKNEELPVINDGDQISGVPCCEDCGTPFTATQDPKTGKILSPSECKDLAIRLRGAPICKKCFAKRKLAQK